MFKIGFVNNIIWRGLYTLSGIQTSTLSGDSGAIWFSDSGNRDAKQNVYYVNALKKF